MFPRLADFGSIEVLGRSFHPILHTYGILMFAGFLLGLYVAAKRAPRYGIQPQHIYDLGLYLVIGALVGAKVLLILLDPARFLANPGGFITAGGVFFGGLLGAVGATIWFCRKRGIPVWNCGDLMAPSIALGHGIGRLGCFAAGCCYGTPAEGLPAVTFTDVYASSVTGVPLNVPLHPTQLYDAGLEFALFFFLLWLAPRRKFVGQLFVTWGILYAVSRFIIEFFRGDPRGFVLDGLLSTSQFVGIWIFAAALISLLVLRRRAA